MHGYLTCSGYGNRAALWPPTADSLPEQSATKIGHLLSHDLMAEYKASETF